MPKAKCPVCNQRRGKRPCPAQQGQLICPKCCAQNRVTVFDCPSDCAYLGAEGSVRLAAQRREGFQPPTEEAMEELLATIGRTEPHARMLDDVEPTARGLLQQLADLSPELFDDALWEWMVFGARTEEGAPLVDRMVQRFQRPLSAQELDALEATHRSQFRLLRVTGEAGPRRVTAEDLLGDQTLEIRHPELKEPLAPGGTLGCFLTPTDQGLTAFVGMWSIPEEGEETLLDRLRELHAESKLEDLQLSEFLTRLSLIVPMLIFEQLADAEVPPDQQEPPPFL